MASQSTSRASEWNEHPAQLAFRSHRSRADNFTYRIDNEPELAQWVATVAGCDLHSAAAYVAEPGLDAVLKTRLQDATTGPWLWAKASPAFGKRLGWYALARVMRPRLIIEIGVHDGLGSLLLLRALERNLEDGFPGRLASFDVNPEAGWLVGTHPSWELRIQSSREGLPEVLNAADDLDMFVYDGWHSYDEERRDIETAVGHLAAGGNAAQRRCADHARPLRRGRQRGLAYLEFQEAPAKHFYPGAVLAAGRGAEGLRGSPAVSRLRGARRRLADRPQGSEDRQQGHQDGA